MDKDVFAKKLKLQVDAKNKLVQGVYGKEAMFDFETIYNESYLTITASNHPHLLALPVTVPNSRPLTLISSPTSLSNSV